MTTIAAKKVPGGIEFAADTMATCGSRPVLKSEQKRGKLFSINGLTIGCSGECSHSRWFRNYCEFNYPHRGMPTFLVEFLQWMREKDSTFTSDNQFIVADGSRLFKVESLLSVCEVPDFVAIGSGCNFAIAALHLGHSVREAVWVASELDVYTSKEIETVSHI